MSTEVILRAYDYTNEDYFDVALDPDSKALLLKDVSAGITDHGSLVGLADDDHPHYYNVTRHTKVLHDGLAIDHGSLTGLADDDHVNYYNAARHTAALHNGLAIDHGNLSGKADNDHTQYLRAFGSWSNKSIDTVYEAATDGFVIAYFHTPTIQGADQTLTGYTDANAAPTTIVARASCNLVIWEGANQASITFPVKSSDYWKVTKSSTDYTVVVKWLPLSN